MSTLSFSFHFCHIWGLQNTATGHISQEGHRNQGEETQTCGVALGSQLQSSGHGSQGSRESHPSGHQTQEGHKHW